MIIYHNAHCGKSRDALNFLQNHGYDPEIIEYLKTPLSVEEIKNILKLAKLKPLDIIRRHEEIFQQFYEGKTFPPRKWIDAIVKHPILLERPIIVYKDKVIIGRSPEQLQEVLDLDK